MTARIIRGNALDLPLADSSVDLICTSPPYFGLRSYQDGGQHYEGQIGAEPTPVEFVDALIAATREMMRVLKPAGSIWVNLGDKYSSGGRGTYDLDHGRREVSTGRPRDGFQPKTLLGIPWRYALRCIDDLGMILRAEVVWSKPNGLPESVTDRVRRSHETWFHFTKQPRYFAGVDEIREDHVAPRPHDPTRGNGYERHMSGKMNGATQNPLGKLPGSVWTIPTQPLRVPPELGVDHFAAFPMEWPRRIIQGWSPVGVCDSCGFLLGSSYDHGMLGVRKELRAANPQRQTSDTLLLEALLEQEQRTEQGQHEVPQADDSGLRRGVEAGSPDGSEERLPDGASAHHVRAPGQAVGAVRSGAPQKRDQDGQPHRELGTAGQDRARQTPQASTQALRLPPLRRADTDLRNAQPCPNCGGSSFSPSVVADVFGGTGTTALVAKVLGRHGVSVDLSADYCRLATWRTNDPGELARAAQVEKPDPVHPDQLDLFGETA